MEDIAHLVGQLTLVFPVEQPASEPQG